MLARGPKKRAWVVKQIAQDEIVVSEHKGKKATQILCGGSGGSALRPLPSVVAPEAAELLLNRREESPVDLLGVRGDGSC